MKSVHAPAAFLIFLLLLSACKPPATEWTSLFNGENLDNWEIHLGPAYEGHEALAEGAVPSDVIAVAEVDGTPAIHIKGIMNASLATVENYGNYHLSMEFKWGDAVYTARNSGLLYHSYGPFGPGLGTWMSGHELQFMTGNLGDSYRMGETWCEIPVVAAEDGKLIYAAGGEMTGFGDGELTKIARKQKDAEKTVGEWNTVDLYCFDRTSVHVVNGEVLLVNYNSGRYEDGAVQPLSSGRLQIQSEGAELYLRNIRMRPIAEIPAELLQ
jgi:hypothetical protein